MKTSKTGLNLIAKFEGLRLTAYKADASEKYYTIGYGHYGADVKKGDKITKAQALAYLAEDVAAAEKAVNKYYKLYKWNQNEFDALVSFAYNIGNIKQLTADGTRSREAIASHMLLYNKCGGKVLKGLTRRRNAERKLFLTEV